MTFFKSYLFGGIFLFYDFNCLIGELKGGGYFVFEGYTII
jgi:hypothetical protein